MDCGKSVAVWGLETPHVIERRERDERYDGPDSDLHIRSFYMALAPGFAPGQVSAGEPDRRLPQQLGTVVGMHRPECKEATPIGVASSAPDRI